MTAFRHPGWAIGLILLLSGLLGTGAGRLKINTDIAQLLPEGYESVENLDKLREEFGGIGYLSVLVSGGTGESRQAFLDEIAPKIEALPSVRYTEFTRPTDFFENKALFYADIEDVKQIRNRFAERERYERLRANPLYIDLEEREPPSLEFADIREKYADKSENLNNERYLVDKKHDRIVMFIKPAHLASDLTFATTLVSEVEDLLQRSLPPTLRAQMSGRYKKRVDTQAMIITDLSTSSAAAILLVLAYLLLHFRRIGSVVLVGTPLLIGLLWAYGFAGWTLGTLNILTAFVGTILAGVGIDMGIHILDRAESEGDGGENSLRLAFAHTGRAAVIATMTTVVGFGSLAFSDFRIFREFGILSSGGLLFVLLAYLLCLPPLLRWRNAMQRAQKKQVHHQSFVSAKAILRSSPWFFWCGMLLIWISFLSFPNLSFNYDFSSLENQNIESYQLDHEINDFLGHSQTPLVVMTANEKEAQQVVAYLRSKITDGTGIDRAVSGLDFVPSDQSKKAELLADLTETLSLIDPASLTDGEREDLKTLRAQASAQPFLYSELPESVRRTFHAIDGSGQFVLAFLGASMSNGSKMRDVAARLRSIPLDVNDDTQSISATGEVMVLSDILDNVAVETPESIGIATFVVFLTLWLFFGRIQLAILCVIPAFFTVLVTIGLMPMVGIEFNYLNIIVLPVLLGLSVDGGVHLVSRIEAEGSIRIGLQHSGRSILAALITTALGFLVLLAARHPGLNTIAQVALLGFSVNLIATLLFLPATIAMWTRYSPYTATSGIIPLLATVGRAGRASVGPGSLGALLAIPIAWAFADFPAWLWGILLVAMTGVSILIGDRYVRTQGAKDPQEIVLDETLGCLIVLAFVPFTLAWVSAAYVLFRIFDIWKPWPIRYIDRNSPGGFGVMMDDVAAGIMAGPILLAVRHLLS